MNKITSPNISILLPCLNEENSISYCLDQIQKIIKNRGADEKLLYEVIIIDNASTDNSVAIIETRRENFPELVLVHESIRGYGSAYMKGVAMARGKYIFMADLDGTYDFNEIPKFISKLKEGYGLVVGNRFATEKIPMPWHHRYIGNPLLSFLVRFFFHVKIHDMHCGMRAMTREAILTISPHATGMEFASEMIVKAAKRGITMTEIPITYRERIGESKLRSFADGWRHLRFILLYSPTALFFAPGITLFGLGFIGMTIFYFTSPKLFGIQFYFHPLFLASAMIIVGYQFIFFGGFARIYAATHLGDSNQWLEKLFRYITIERASMVGIIATIIGACVYIRIFTEWIGSGFGSLDEIQNSIVALTLVVLGVETIASAFMLSILGIKEK